MAVAARLTASRLALGATVLAALAVLTVAVWPAAEPAEAPVASAALEPPSASSPPPVASAAPRVAATAPRSDAVPGAVSARDSTSRAWDTPIEDDSEYWRIADIEDFKREIYALEIDSLDEIDQLDAFVAIEVEDPRELWDTDWAGVDDWKRNQDGFRLERSDDGTMMLVPGVETQRAYTFFESINAYDYDEENESFIHQVDYYGKPIFNVLKFLREDVLVMMTVSGEKVDLQIFEQGEAPD